MRLDVQPNCFSINKTNGENTVFSVVASIPYNSNINATTTNCSHQDTFFYSLVWVKSW